MRFSSTLSAVISAALAAHQVSCVAVHNNWLLPTGFGNVTEIVSSIRVPSTYDYESSYYMANGFSGGYMGMQHNTGTDRRILFSIWDNGHGSTVDLVSKGNNVTAEGFGGEGTGAHAILHYPWAVEQTIFFKVTSDPDFVKNGATFTGYFSTDEGKTWQLVASFFAEKQPHYLANPYGFLEDFAGNGKIREAYWGNFTATNSAGKTANITDFHFTHTTPSKTSVWEQRILPNHEIYQRISGTKDQGIYSPTNP